LAFHCNVYTSGLAFVRSLGMANPYEHGSVGRSAAGYDTYNAVGFDDAQPGTLITFDLSTGARSVVIGPATGWPYPPGGTHVSALATQKPGWVASSIVGDPAGGCVLCQELVIAQPETGRVCRVAHHHSHAGEGQWGYWAEPHVVMSPSGTRLLFGSDWENGATVDSYVVELPSYQ
jgi:hypothetical protein